MTCRSCDGSCAGDLLGPCDFIHEVIASALPRPLRFLLRLI